MTKNELKNWVLRNLGSPYINVELHSEQIDDQIEQALTLFHRQHYDGSVERYITFPVVPGTLSYDMPETVVEVLEVYDADDSWWTSDDPLLIRPFLVGNEIYENLYGHYSVVDTEFFRQRISRINQYYNYDVMFQYNTTTKVLDLHVTPKQNATLGAKCYVRESDQTKYYTNDWLRHYIAALCKKQWGQNVSKYSGTALPGGVQLNYEKILAEAQTEITKLETDLEIKYSKTIDIMVG